MQIIDLIGLKHHGNQICINQSAISETSVILILTHLQPGCFLASRSGTQSRKGGELKHVLSEAFRPLGRSECFSLMLYTINACWYHCHPLSIFSNISQTRPNSFQTIISTRACPQPVCLPLTPPKNFAVQTCPSCHVFSVCYVQNKVMGAICRIWTSTYCNVIWTSFSPHGVPCQTPIQHLAGRW